MSYPSLLLDIFTLEDAVFHGLSFDRIKFMGNLHFWTKKVKILEKTMFFSSKNHRINPFFPENDIGVKLKNIGIVRTKDALSFGMSRYYVNFRNN